MTLRLAHSRDDLPRSWDGRHVEWGPWRSGASSADLHVPPTDLACPDCGVIDARQIATGYVNGGFALLAFRCGCGRDEVHDRRTNETWVLDDTDYGPQGSVETKGALW